MIRFLTTIEPAPEGFEPTTLAKKELLSGVVGVLVGDLDRCLASLDDFAARVHGCVATPGEAFTVARLGDLLWHMTLPDSLLADAHVLMESVVDMAEMIGGLQTKIEAMEVEKARICTDLAATRGDYNRTTEKLLKQVGEMATLNTELQDKVDRLVRAEHTLKESEQNQRIILDSIGDGVIVTNQSGDVVRMNPVACQVTGWGQEEAIGKPLCDVLQLLDAETRKPIPDPAKAVLETGLIETQAMENLSVSKDGSEHRIDHNAAPLHDNGTVIGVVVVFRDMTEQYELAERLHQSRKMESIGHLAGGVAHDFNNMLGGMMGAAEMLHRKLSDGDSNQAYATMIMETGQRAAELTGKLLAFSRKAKAVSTPFSIQQSIDDALAILERSVDRRIEVQRQYAANDVNVVGDPSQIQNAILNLGLNARDAMPEGGTLTVSTERVKLDEDYCRTSSFDLQAGEFVRILVKDTGTGIEPNVLQHIFEPFFTTKKAGAGTGLGLAAVYGTVQEHHGAITLTSEKGKGTAFEMVLPVAAVPVRPAITSSQNVASSAPVPAAGRGCLLLVDDEDIIRTTGARLLEDLGYEVVTAEDGVKGLRLFQRYHRKIRLVLLDMVMPKMSGPECFQKIRQVDPQAKIVLCSGFTSSSTIDGLMKQGAVGFITKPYLLDDLVKVLDQAEA